MMLGNIMLSERSQSQKATCMCFYFYENSRIAMSIERESRFVVARGLGEQRMGNEANGEWGFFLR